MDKKISFNWLHSSALDCFSITGKLSVNRKSFPSCQTLRDNFVINGIGDPLITLGAKLLNADWSTKGVLFFLNFACEITGTRLVLRLPNNALCYRDS